ncbi:hypothetical protein HDV62DRAFT_187213 [Trichoderma sp. SZMC 28011]
MLNLSAHSLPLYISPCLSSAWLFLYVLCVVIRYVCSPGFNDMKHLMLALGNQLLHRYLPRQQRVNLQIHGRFIHLCNALLFFSLPRDSLARTCPTTWCQCCVKPFTYMPIRVSARTTATPSSYRSTESKAGHLGVIEVSVTTNSPCPCPAYTIDTMPTHAVRVHVGDQYRTTPLSFTAVS